MMNPVAANTQIEDAAARQARRVAEAQAEYERELQNSQNERKQSAINAMIIGALICVVGLGITIWTYSTAAGGGRYVVAYGAIISGVIQFFRGLWAYAAERRGS